MLCSTCTTIFRRPLTDGAQFFVERQVAGLTRAGCRRPQRGRRAAPARSRIRDVNRAPETHPTAMFRQGEQSQSNGLLRARVRSAWRGHQVPQLGIDLRRVSDRFGHHGAQTITEAAARAVQRYGKGIDREARGGAVAGPASRCPRRSPTSRLCFEDFCRPLALYSVRSSCTARSSMLAGPAPGSRACSGTSRRSIISRARASSEPVAPGGRGAGVRRRALPIRLRIHSLVRKLRRQERRNVRNRPLSGRTRCRPSAASKPARGIPAYNPRPRGGRVPDGVQSCRAGTSNAVQ